jgi:hypothetical protein
VISKGFLALSVDRRAESSSRTSAGGSADDLRRPQRHGNHMRRRRLWPLHLGGVVIVRCELCNIVRRQRWTRWEQMSEPLNAPASGNWRSTNCRH